MIGHYLVAAFAILLASGVASANLVTAGDDKPDCAASRDDFPRDESLQSKLAKTDDNQSLVNVTSYLVLLDPSQSGYLPLQLQTVTQTTGSHPTDGKDATLSLGFNCAQIDVGLSQLIKEKQWTINRIQATLYGGKQPLACSTSQLGYTFPVGQRYSCLGRLVFSCLVDAKDEAGTSYAEPVAEIVFANGLELELGGRPELIKDKKFSMEPYKLSCPRPSS